MPSYSAGQKVRYKPVGSADSNTSESVGLIKSVHTSPNEEVAGRHMKSASEDMPCYEIENMNTHKTQPIYESNVLREVEEE